MKLPDLEFITEDDAIAAHALHGNGWDLVVFVVGDDEEAGESPPASDR